ncbi:MAG: hypothetical protein M1819_001439 [Sarea resinae]|nr:MAG: hypothetical protein M1819_001439 [Sarea resinae]
MNEDSLSTLIYTPASLDAFLCRLARIPKRPARRRKKPTDVVIASVELGDGEAATESSEQRIEDGLDLEETAEHSDSPVIHDGSEDGEIPNVLDGGSPTIDPDARTAKDRLESLERCEMEALDECKPRLPLVTYSKKGRIRPRALHSSPDQAERPSPETMDPSVQRHTLVSDAYRTRNDRNAHQSRVSDSKHRTSLTTRPRTRANATKIHKSKPSAKNSQKRKREAKSKEYNSRHLPVNELDLIPILPDDVEHPFAKRLAVSCSARCLD